MSGISKTISDKKCNTNVVEKINNSIILNHFLFWKKKRPNITYAWCIRITVLCLKWTFSFLYTNLFPRDKPGYRITYTWALEIPYIFIFSKILHVRIVTQRNSKQSTLFQSYLFKERWKLKIPYKNKVYSENHFPTNLR